MKNQRKYRLSVEKIVYCIPGYIHLMYISFIIHIYMFWGGSMSQVVGSNNSYKPITNTAWARTQLCKLQKGYTRLAAASDKVYQLLVQGRWFSPGTPASFITKTGRHDISEILLKVALSTKIRILYMFCNIYEWLNELDRWIYATHTSLSPIRRGFAPGFVNY